MIFSNGWTRRNHESIAFSWHYFISCSSALAPFDHTHLLPKPFPVTPFPTLANFVVFWNPVKSTLLHKCGLPLECGQPTRGYTLRENGLALSLWLSVLHDSTVGVRFGAQLPPPCSGLVWLGLTLVLDIYHTAISSCVRQPNCPEDSGSQ